MVELAAVPLALGLILTFVAPFVNALVIRVNWSPQTKNLVAIATSALIAVGYLLATGGIGDWSQLAVVVPAVYGLQQAVYHFLFKDLAQKVAESTDPTVKPTPEPVVIPETESPAINKVENHTPLKG